MKESSFLLGRPSLGSPRNQDTGGGRVQDIALTALTGWDEGEGVSCLLQSSWLLSYRAQSLGPYILGSKSLMKALGGTSQQTSATSLPMAPSLQGV